MRHSSCRVAEPGRHTHKRHCRRLTPAMHRLRKTLRRLMDARSSPRMTKQITPPPKEPTMQVNPYLYYDGNCEAAFKFYEKAVGGKIEVLMTHESAPPEMHDAAGMEEEDHARPHYLRRRDPDGLRRASRPLPQAARLFGDADGRRSRRRRAEIQGIERRRRGQHGVRADLLRQGFRHVRRPVRNPVDGDLARWRMH